MFFHARARAPDAGSGTIITFREAASQAMWGPAAGDGGFSGIGRTEYQKKLAFPQRFL
jgi:hypothetical protein